MIRQAARPGRLAADPRVRLALAIATLILIAGAVRAVAMGSRLHIDDAYSWYVAGSRSWGEFLRRLAANENSPPVFYLVLGLVPGSTPAWLRVPAVLAGTLMTVVVFASMHRRLGMRPSLVSALAVAVAPFLITYSDLARGFMLANLALLLAVWALLAMGDSPSPRWAPVGFVSAGAVACYAEYDSMIVVTGLVLAAVLVGGWPRRRVLICGGLVVALMLPWIPELVRAQHQVGHTKLSPMFSTPSLTGLRDIAVTLLFGEHGATASSAGRWALFAVICGALGLIALLARWRWAVLTTCGQRIVLMLSATAVLTLVGYAIVGLIGINIFTQRYLTILVPLVAVPVIAVLDQLPRRAPLVAIAIALGALGVFDALRRDQANYEPPFAPVRAAALAAHPRTVLTNTPVVLYYLRGLAPRFDRPFNLGPGMAATCVRPCLIVDDSRVHGGTPRPLPEPPATIAPYQLWLER